MAELLCTVDQFKTWYKITSSGDDALIQDLLEGVSADMLAYMDRQSMLLRTYTEYYDGTGTPKLMLRQWPVQGVTTFKIDGVAQVAAVQPNVGYFLDPAEPAPPGSQQYVNMIGGSASGGANCYGGSYIAKGVKNVQLVYDAGYAVASEAQSVPATGPYTITADQDYGPWAQDDGVAYSSGGSLSAAASSTGLTVGQYYASSGVYTLSSADAGASLLLDYSFIPATINKLCYQIAAEEYSYRQRTGQKSHTMGGQVTTAFDNAIMTEAIEQKIQPFMRKVPW